MVVKTTSFPQPFAKALSGHWLETMKTRIEAKSGARATGNVVARLRQQAGAARLEDELDTDLNSPRVVRLIGLNYLTERGRSR
jgi:hypothetical protein